MENVKLLFQLYYRPAAAMSDIIDRGSWIFAAVAMLLVLFAFQLTINTRIESGYNVSPHVAQPDVEGGAPNTDSARLKPEFPALGRDVLYLVSFESFAISPLVSLLLFFTPALLILARAFGAAGYAGTNARNNYLPLSTCMMMAWTAAHLPFTVAGA